MEVRQKYVCLVYSTLVFAWLFPFQAIDWHLCSSSAPGMVKRLDAKPQGKATSIVPVLPSDLCTEVGGLRCVTTSCLLVSFFFAISQTSLYHIYITPPDYSTLSYFPFIYHVINGSWFLALLCLPGRRNWGPWIVSDIEMATSAVVFCSGDDGSFVFFTSCYASKHGDIPSGYST